jgi:hypothetical protein
MADYDYLAATVGAGAFQALCPDADVIWGIPLTEGTQLIFTYDIGVVSETFTSVTSQMGCAVYLPISD